MTLRRFQPVSRAAQWCETIAFTDLRTRDVQDLTDVVLTLAVYQEGIRRRDYGFSPAPRWYGDGRTTWGIPVLSAATQADGSGPFVILPGNLSAQFTFPATSLVNLRPGPAQIIIWATANGATDEALRDTLEVLEGPLAPPMVPVVVVPPTPDPSAGITVIVDGGDR